MTTEQLKQKLINILRKEALAAKKSNDQYYYSSCIMNINAVKEQTHPEVIKQYAISYGLI